MRPADIFLKNLIIILQSFFCEDNTGQLGLGFFVTSQHAKI
jgi:hypothetical protein